MTSVPTNFLRLGYLFISFVINTLRIQAASSTYGYLYFAIGFCVLLLSGLALLSCFKRFADSLSKLFWFILDCFTKATFLITCFIVVQGSVTKILEHPFTKPLYEEFLVLIQTSLDSFQDFILKSNNTTETL